MTKDKAKREAYRIVAALIDEPIDMKARGLKGIDAIQVRHALNEIAAAMERAAGGGT